MFHSTSILVVSFSIAISAIVFLPFIGPSIISTLIDFLTSNCTISLHLEFLKAIITSLSMMFPVLLIFFIDLVPCQNSGSLSISAITSHTLSSARCYISASMNKNHIFLVPMLNKALNNNNCSRLV